MSARRQAAVLHLPWLVPPLFGLLALALGLDANWDLRNYHYYNGWALLHGRLGQDLLPAQTPGFFNPVLDGLYYLATTVLPARGVAFGLGTVQGLNFVLLYGLAHTLLSVRPAGVRRLAAAALALAGMAAALNLSQIGTVFWDNVVSLGVLGALLIVARHWQAWREGRGRAWIGSAAAAGLLLGLSFACKQTTALYLLAAGLCLPFFPAPAGRRLALLAVCGLGAVAGVALGGGWWMWTLWQHYDNPLFPFFNEWFRSPWALPASYRDPGFLPDSPGLGEAVLFPLRVALDSRLGSEVVYTDGRLACAWGLGLLALPGLAWRRLRGLAPACALLRPAPALGLLLFAALALALWLVMFRISRYLMVLELLAPLLISAAVQVWPGRAAVQAALVAVVLAACVLTQRVPDWGRTAWTRGAVEVQAPAIAEPGRTLGLLAGHEPLAYLLPGLPPVRAWLRIDSTFTNPDQSAVAFNPLMQARVTHHDGPLAVLYGVDETADVRHRLDQYGLAIVPARCAPVRANLAPDVQYRYCALERTGR